VAISNEKLTVYKKRELPLSLKKENPDLMEGDTGDGKEKEVRFKSIVANWPDFWPIRYRKSRKRAELMKSYFSSSYSL
jgi:hypothetical protein